MKLSRHQHEIVNAVVVALALAVIYAVIVAGMAGWIGPRAMPAMDVVLVAAGAAAGWAAAVLCEDYGRG